MSVSGPKLGRTLLTVPKCESVENSGNSSSGSDQEYPGLQIENLKHALERGQVQSSLGVNPDIQNFYHKLKEIQRIQQPEKPKNSFSIDSLAKSASNQNSSSFAPPTPHAASANPFTMQSQEMYRKALENLHHSARTMTPGIVPTHGINQLMGMRGGLFPAQTQAHLIQQAQIARMQAQRHQHTPEHRLTSRGQAMKLSSSIVREARNQMKGLDPENMYIECPLCHKRIKRLYHFQRHMRIHSGEKSHQCPYCPYKSVRKDNLKSHLKTHEKHALEARRNAEMLDKKRNNEFEAIRRLHLNNAMKKIQMPTMQISPQMAQPTQSTSQCCAPPTRCSSHPIGFDYQQVSCCKEEPVAEVTEIDSGCESPQEQSSPLRAQMCNSDTSGIESGQSERHSSKESDSSFDSPERIIDVTK